MTLSLIPCGDGSGGIIEIVNHLFGMEHQEHQHEGHEHDSTPCHDDDCTPFCVCSCCSTVLDSPVELPLQIKGFHPVPAASPAFVPNVIQSTFTAQIWQPPMA